MIKIPIFFIKTFFLENMTFHNPTRFSRSIASRKKTKLCHFILKQGRSSHIVIHKKHKIITYIAFYIENGDFNVLVFFINPAKTIHRQSTLTYLQEKIF